jgi:putative transposase
MSRLACPQAPGVALHVVQRGRDGAACFVTAREASAYLHALGACAAGCRCAVHAYVLMSNHVHLLVTPARRAGATELMTALAESCRRPLGEARGCPATPWEDGFDASPVYAPRYLLACMRYIEENPVRAGLARDPGAWRWSSFGANAAGREDPIVTPHGVYCALGRTPQERRRRYRAMFRDASVLPRPA